MLKRVLMTLVLFGMLSIVAGCEKDEIRTHEHKQIGPTVVEQYEVVE